MKVIYWLQIFVAPVIICGIIALFIYSNHKFLSISLLILGIAIGVFLAEFIGRKYGLDKFFARLYSNEQDNPPVK